MSQISQLREAMDDVQRSLGRIEGNLKAITNSHNSQQAHNAETDKRLRSVENKQYWFSGVSTFIGTLIGSAATILTRGQS